MDGFRAPRDVREIASRYTGQLVHGCGHPACREVLCDTGRRNAAPPNRPVRRWTPRSARAIALAVAGSPSPRRHLCQHYNPIYRNDEKEYAEIEGPRDPLSMEQLLCDAQSVRHFCAAEHISLKPCQYDYLQRSLEPLLESTFLESTAVPNDKVAGILCTALLQLLEDLPASNVSQIGIANHIINRAAAYPDCGSNLGRSRSWLLFLDALENGPAIRILTRICRFVALRSRFESAIVSLNSQLDIGRELSDSLPNVLNLTVNKLLQGQKHKNVLGLIVWLKKIFLLNWNGLPVVTDSVALGALELVDGLYIHCNSSRMVKDFCALPAVPHRLELAKTAESWLWRAANTRHILTFRFLFSPKERAKYFRAVNHLKMRGAHSRAEKHIRLRQHLVPFSDDLKQEVPQFKYNEDYYLLLNVSRKNVLRDAYDQLWQRRTGELFRPLRVRLGEIEELEIGQDLGGVQIEFFNLVCKDVFVEEAGMFTALDRRTGMSYFRPGSLQPLYMFELFGLLMALAIYNGITLPINLPPAFYAVLLASLSRDGLPLSAVIGYSGSAFGLPGIRRGWPIEALSLQSILDTSSAGEDLEASFPMEANGLRMSVHLPKESGILEVVDSTPPLPQNGISWPGWHLVRSGVEAAALEESNKVQYVHDYANWLIWYSVKPQWVAFLRGFSRVVSQQTLTIFPGEDSLKAYIEGSSSLNIGELRKATRYEGYYPDSKYIKTFWDVVESWTESKQKQLLKFVTAAERIPIGGASNITFVVQKTDLEDDARLPTSSTCFGTLILPRYRNADILNEKLSLAIEYGLEGFGTG